MVFVLIVTSISFAVTLHLGQITWQAGSEFWQYLPKFSENIENYQEFIIRIFQISVSGILIFLTPVFFCTFLSLLPRRKMIISPWYSQTMVFCLFLIYFAMFPPSDKFVLASVMSMLTIFLMFAGFTQHVLVEKLVGVELSNIAKYSLKTRNASIKQVVECLMNPDVRKELRLSENSLSLYNGMRIMGKSGINNVALKIKETASKDETLINIVFYRLSKNNFVSSNLENYAWKQYQFMKKALFDSKISFQEEDSEKNSAFLIESLEESHSGSHKNIVESVKQSKYKIPLFLIGIGIIVYLFWDRQFENAIFAVLTILLYLVFEVTLYVRKNQTSESITF